MYNSTKERAKEDRAINIFKSNEVSLFLFDYFIRASHERIPGSERTVKLY